MDKNKELKEPCKTALKENNIMKAVGCKTLANNLRKDIGEEEI